ncbi:transferrin-binding protein-like solute binding protein [Nitratireductor sp. XY-223]|uniref:transferrin-binding protein-like solute binding protein n=1 Tax=Nitratireductor sp. XY-223 TaxID=2561926 RepID=UPI0010A9B1EA|nr:transferrin-binding protein-like solute binding protein [Nitratireductor sp. XY-223]
MEQRLAAEAALETAQAQAKIAEEKAAAAVEAAGLEVKVAYDEDGKATYRVGDVTIVAAAPKMEKTEDGKEVVTGRLGDFITVGNTGRAAVAYRETPERLAQPAFAARSIGIGSFTDSADDSARLLLVDKYVTPDTDTTAGIYTIADTPAEDIAGESVITDTTPYGTVSRGGGNFVIRRAQGVFYLATGPDLALQAKPGNSRSANANRFTIAGNVRAAAADGDGAVAAWSNTMTATADFEDNTLTTTLTGLATLEGDIDGNGFSGTDVSGVGTTGGLTGGDRYTGNFFGPEFEEVEAEAAFA